MNCYYSINSAPINIIGNLIGSFNTIYSRAHKVIARCIEANRTFDCEDCYKNELEYSIPVGITVYLGGRYVGNNVYLTYTDNSVAINVKIGEVNIETKTIVYLPEFINYCINHNLITNNINPYAVAA